MTKQIILTGIKPTGMPHIGNYFGAIKPAIEMTKTSYTQNEYFFFVADYHALTATKDPKTFQDHVYDVAATWLACGLDPQNVTIYRQSDIPEVFELAWILNCHTPKGDMNRAHAYKAVVDENLANNNNSKDPDHGVNMGLYSYPVLMAADILLFNASVVPVGKDQVQHIEITRSIAQRINQHYGEIFIQPKESLQKDMDVILGLDGRKMSKSYDNTIPLFIPENKLKKLINRIATDSTDVNAPKNPDTSLIYAYYKYFATNEEIANFRSSLEKGISWGEAKAILFEKMNSEITPKRKIYEDLIQNKSKIDEILNAGAQKARAIAKKNLEIVRKKIIGTSALL